MKLIESLRQGYQQGLAAAGPKKNEQGSPQRKRAGKGSTSTLPPAAKKAPRKAARPRPPSTIAKGLLLLLALLVLAFPKLLILGLALLPFGGNAGKQGLRGLGRMGGDIDRDRT